MPERQVETTALDVVWMGRFLLGEAVLEIVL